MMGCEKDVAGGGIGMSHAIVKAKLVARKKIRKENRILENTATGWSQIWARK
jgi:hypothetical protein